MTESSGETAEFFFGITNVIGTDFDDGGVGTSSSRNSGGISTRGADVKKGGTVPCGEQPAHNIITGVTIIRLKRCVFMVSSFLN
jgi:hypothetical protein